MYFLKKLVKNILKYEAKLILKKYKPKIIAISGSVGKTLTKEAIYLVLSKKFFVRKSEKSFTTELGIPLSVIGCKYNVSSAINVFKNVLLGLWVIVWNVRYPNWLILEIDGDKPGDLSFVNQFLSIDFLIMTAIGHVPSHIESFYDTDNFIFEKKFVINAVKRDGAIIYNSDDEQTYKLIKEADLKKISCGIGGDAVIQGSDFKILYSNNKSGQIPIGMSFDIKIDGWVKNISILESIGIHNEYAHLLAFALGLELGLEKNDILFQLSKYKSLPGRMNIISGIKDTVIIDDSYNASPIAMSQALMVFGDIKWGGRKIVVLGDMLELGKYSAEEHKKLSEYVRNTASVVISVGLRMRKLSEELLNQGFDELNIISADSSEEARKIVERILQPGDIVLVKGSQLMRMERVVEEIMRHPEDKNSLLVRQEPEWLNRK